MFLFTPKTMLLENLRRPWLILYFSTECSSTECSRKESAIKEAPRGLMQPVIACARPCCIEDTRRLRRAVISL